jgi:predicted PolB exonuclease-like 3'-5' exonuclease
MGNHVLAWDLETVPDLAAVARVHGLGETNDMDARSALGDKFPKPPLHKIACIGALVAERTGTGWQVKSLGAPHVGERSEAELLQSFVDRIDDLKPQLVTFNGTSFDLPVLRYRAMLNRVAAPGLARRPYFNRYTEDALDICDALAAFDQRSKCSLNDLCRIFGFPGKPEEIDGSQVARYVEEGRITEVAAYCETDVVSTYRIWLVYELFRGALSRVEFEASEQNLLTFVEERVPVKPYLAYLLGEQAIDVSPLPVTEIVKSEIDVSSAMQVAPAPSP